MADCHPFHHQLCQHGVPLRRFAMRLTGNEHRSEDLVQETFLKAWANRDKYTPGTELKGWLFTILRNTFYSDYRKYKRETEDVDDRLALRLFEEDAQDHVVALKELIAAVARLPEIQRRPLVLMGAYGFSQIEAADACGCNVGTIKSRVSRGRATLDRAFGREPETPARTAMAVSNRPTAKPDFLAPRHDNVSKKMAMAVHAAPT